MTSLLLQSPPKNTRWFIRRLNDVSPGNLRALWLPHPTDTTTNVLKPDGRTWTYGNPGGLISNGDFETNTTGWATSGTNTIAQSTTVARFGANSLKCTFQDTGTDLASFVITITAVAHTFSVYAWVPSDYDGPQPGLQAQGFTSATGTTFVAFDLTKRDQWQRVSCTFTPDAGDVAGRFRVLENGSNPTAGKFIYIDGARAETGSTATAFGANISYQGNGILVSFASASSHHTSTPDTDNLSFGDGSTDSPFSLVVAANVTSTAATKQLITKDSGSFGAREYQFAVTAAGLLRFIVVDNSTGTSGNRASNAAINQGSLACLGVSYTPAGGGATTYDSTVLYQNGVAIASTANNVVSYVAMENLGQAVDVGSAGDGTVNLLNGSVGFAAIYAAALTADQHARIASICRRYYKVAL